MDFKEIYDNYNVIFLTKFGSHLYGTDTPESDADYKGVFIPTKEQIMLGNIPKQVSFDSNTSNQKNSKDDIDCQLYSLHYFLELLRKAETVALDMIHSTEQVIHKTIHWDYIYDRRRFFYTKNMKAFMGYCKKQAAKYGMKGSRINSAKKLLDFLNTKDDNQRISEFWEQLPTDEHSTFSTCSPHNPDIRLFNFCGKQLQETIKVSYAKDIVQSFLDKYGDRARKAANNEEVDWKAMSHAIRATLQLEEIYTTGDLKFPLKDAEYLKLVKQGQLDFKGSVLPTLEDGIERVEKLAEQSNYPENIKSNFVNLIIIDVLENYHGEWE
jgi:predicted nucleotidyltransferase